MMRALLLVAASLLGSDPWLAPLSDVESVWAEVDRADGTSQALLAAEDGRSVLELLAVCDWRKVEIDPPSSGRWFMFSRDKSEESFGMLLSNSFFLGGTDGSTLLCELSNTGAAAIRQIHESRATRN
jgi:hypothetical protein